MNTQSLLYGSALQFLIACSTIFAQFQHGNDHNGFYADVSIENSAVLEWKVQTNGAVRSTPAISGNSIIIGSSDGTVYCLRKNDGKELWRVRVHSPVSSSPAIDNGVVYFSTRSNKIYAVKLKNGTPVWEKQLGTPLPYTWGFDYYVSSPAVDGLTIFIGGSDGYLYALNKKTGAEQWKYRTSSSIRSTPAIDQNNVYFGDCSGKVYAIQKTAGILKWQFNTIGDTLKNESFGFDRKAVISSPTVYKNTVFIGGRDGYLYALEKETGKEIWQFDYSVSWVISTAAVRSNILVTATSDGRFIHALNSDTGKELWRFTTNGPVWASPAITSNNRIIIAGNDGYVYCLELSSGSEVWRFSIGEPIFSSTKPEGNQIFFGSDDGCIYSLKTIQAKRRSVQSVKRAVFWTKNPSVQSFRSGMDVYIRDYFIREGYEFYDETDVKDFLLARINSDTASVVVFATNYFIPAITDDTLGSNILKTYLTRGGKIVILGLNPAAYLLDSSKTKVIGLDFDQAKHVTGISYPYKDLRAHGGFYSSEITADGKQWGLRDGFVGICGMPLSGITTPLAVDENGNATAWVKSFSERKYSGFVQLYLTPSRLTQLPQVQKVAEYGLFGE